MARFAGGREEVSREDVMECEDLFLDVGRSVGALEADGGGVSEGWIE